MNIIVFIFASQLLFSISNILGRQHMKASNVSYWRLLARSWIVGYLSIRVVAIFLNLYVFYSMYISRASICSSCISLLFSAVIGSLYLKEKITKYSLFALMLIVIALILQGWH